MSSPALPSLQALENAEEFLARHIGIDAADEARMLPVIGSATRAELIDGIVPAAIRRARPMPPARAGDRGRRAGGTEADGGQEQGVAQLHRPGLLRHAHARRHPAQHPREPRLVHGLHALPGRNIAGPHGSPAQLPDHGLRPHGHGHRQRLDARRSHRRRRSHDARQAQREEQEQRVPGVGRLPSADHRGHQDARRAAGHRGQGQHRVGNAAATSWWPANSSACWRNTPPPRATCTTCARSRAMRISTTRPSSSRPTCWRSRCWRPPANGAPTSSAVPRSASACRCATAARMRPTWHAAIRSSVRCRAASSA